LTKSQIRNKILLRLKTQKEAERNRKSKIIQEKLFNSTVFKQAKVVMFYVSFDGEVNTKEMIKEAQNLGKIVAVPVCKKNRKITPCRLEAASDLKRGPYGVCEPALKRVIDLEELGLVIVPGVAFDKKGSRLGRGKGYYDRFLKKIPKQIPSVGLAFDFQVLPSIPATKHDITVRKLIFA